MKIVENEENWMAIAMHAAAVARGDHAQAAMILQLISDASHTD